MEMSNQDKYRHWVDAVNALDARHLIGEITGEERDRLYGNLLERLGMNQWSQDTWAREAKWYAMLGIVPN
jgi:hypothetical protein